MIVQLFRHGSPAPNRMTRSGPGNSAPVPGPSTAGPASSRGAWTGCMCCYDIFVVATFFDVILIRLGGGSSGASVTSLSSAGSLPSRYGTPTAGSGGRDAG